MQVRAFLAVSALASALLISSAPAAAEVKYEIHGNCAVVHVPPNNLKRDGTADPVIFLNRCVGGCVLEPGDDDSRTNTTSVFNDVTYLSEFAHGDQVWNDMVDCIKEQFRPYNVRVTTEDPGPNSLYLESIIAGDTTESGLGPQVMGVSPASCSPLSHTISFSFANSHDPDWRELCETVTHEAGHTLSLDHDTDCSDLMWWTVGDICGRKFFRNKGTECGEGDPSPCMCTGTVQNAHVKLLGAWGPGEGAYPPEVSIASPAEGDNVDNEFVVYAYASDDRGIGHVDLYVNGWKWNEVEGHDGDTPYVLRTPANLPDGVLEIEARAHNDLDVPTSATVTVLKGAPCTSADSCLDGQLCDEGKCYWPPASVPLGGDCERVQDCIEGDCIEKDGLKLCSDDCIPMVTGQCGEEEECITTSSGTGFCWPLDAGGGGGCCAVSDDSEPPWGELGLFIGVVLLGLRRRRTTR